MTRPGEPAPIWVTGARGLLGRALVAALHAAGHDVIATGREADVADRDCLLAALGGRRPRCIFNAAAYTAVDRAEAEPARAHRDNVVGAEVLALLARDLAASLVHFSTDYVFDGTSAQPLGEDAPTAPLNVYGRTKRDGELRVLATATPAHRVIVLRTSWLFGPGGPDFVTTMLELARTRPELHVVDDQHGRPTYAPDLAALALAIGIGPLAHLPSQILHAANAGPTTWHGFASAIVERARAHRLPVLTHTVHAVTSAAFPRPARRPAWSVLDTSRLERALADAGGGERMRGWTAALDAHLADLTR